MIQSSFILKVRFGFKFDKIMRFSLFFDLSFGSWHLGGWFCFCFSPLIISDCKMLYVYWLTVRKEFNVEKHSDLTTIVVIIVEYKNVRSVSRPTTKYVKMRVRLDPTLQTS